MNEKISQRGFFGIIIPKEVLEDKTLSLADKVIYGYFSSFSKCCYEANHKIADKLGISASSVAHSISRLVSGGYIFVDKKGNARKIYAVFGSPNKLAYLQKKYATRACGKPVENSKRRVQILHDGVQNLQTKITGVGSAKFAHIEYRIKKNKGKIDKFCGAECPPKALCGAFGGRPKRSSDPDEFEQEFYKRNTIKLGAI